MAFCPKGHILARGSEDQGGVADLEGQGGGKKMEKLDRSE